MRVLHAISSISPARGGPSFAVRNIAQALRRRGVEVDIVTTDDDGATRRACVPLGQFVDMEGQRVIYLPRQTEFYSASMPAMRWLLAHVGEYDIVHTHCLYSFIPNVTAMAARARGVPYLMRPAGMLDRWGLANRRPRLKQISIRYVEAPLLRSAARVHFVSDHERTQADELRLGIRPVVLPLGLDLRSFMEHAPDAASDVETVLYLSRIDRMKGLDALLQAFQRVAADRPRARLIIAGDGPAELVNGFRRLAVDLGIADRVEWPGFVSGERKTALLRSASVFVLASRSENFGIAIAEAMAAGLPVVVTDGVGLSQLVQSCGCGIVTDGSAPTVAQAIDELLRDPERRSRMSAAARRAVDDHLSLDAFGSRLENLYHSLLDDSSRTRRAS